jgi:trigger factor
MSTGEDEREPAVEVEGQEGQEQADDSGTPPKRKIDLNVTITDSGPCKKHIAIEIPQVEVERQFDDTLKDMRKEAQVPGFRPGRAPRGLVQRRFRKEVAGQVKSNLLVACMERLDEDYKLNPITQPNLDLEAIEIPDHGPLTFELDVEVQPEFDVPSYKGMRLKRPVKTINDRDIAAQLEVFLERYAQLVPKLEGGAELGDFVIADLVFHKDGVTLNTAKELQFRLQSELRFQDGRIPDLAGSLVGARPGDVRDAEAQVGTSSPDPALRGQTIRVTIRVQDLKRLRLPELNAEFLESIGFESVDELREALRDVLERRVRFQQRQALRHQLLDSLIAQVPFDLPHDLVARQERKTLRRQVEEMRQHGLSESQIRAREAEVRANAHEQTLKSLKEYFLLSRVAQAEGIEIAEDDIDMEIDAIAARTDESPRRIRARIEKEELAEGLAQQILERKTLDAMLEAVTIEDVPMDEEEHVETVDRAAVAAPEELGDESTPPSE